MHRMTSHSPSTRRGVSLSLAFALLGGFGCFGCFGASAVIPLEKLISIRVHAASNSLIVGDSMALSASGTTNRGAATPVQAAWQSSAPTVMSVSTTGTVHAITQGTAWIVATSDSLADSVQMSVLAPEPALVPGFTNMPAGMTVLADADLTALTGAWTYVPNTGTATIVADSTSPANASVMQFNYPIGFAGGTAPAKLRAAGTPDATGTYNYQQFYLGFYWKADTAWQNHPSNVNKIAFFWINNNYNVYLVWHWWDGSSMGVPPRSLLVNGLPPNTVNDFITPNQPGLFSLQPGHWYKIEWYVKLATTSTSNDGIVRIWVNDRLMMNYTNRSQSGYLSDVYFDPIWGGVGGTKVQNDYYRLAHARLAER